MKRQMNRKFWRTFFSVFLNALLVVAVILIFLWMHKMAYYTFSNQPYQNHKSESVSIVVKDEEAVKDLAIQLEKKKIVENRLYIKIRYYCSDYQHYHLREGTYKVSANMGVDDLLEEFTGR